MEWLKRTIAFVLTIVLIFGIIEMPMNVSAKEADKSKITEFGNLKDNEKSFYISKSSKPSLSELIEVMPKTLNVILDNNTKKDIEVSWECVGEEYENPDSYYFQFSPIWDEKLYVVDESFNVIKDAPYISVFLYDGDGTSEISVTQNQNEQIIFNFLTNDMAMNSAAASGVLANLYHESSFNPNALGDSGTSYGICQWHNERWEAMKTWCSNNGHNWQTLIGQLNYLKFELSQNNGTYLYNGKTIYDYLLSVSKTAEGAYNAGWYWCYYYEVPANRDSVAITRGNLARDTYWSEYREKETYPFISYIDSPTTGTVWENNVYVNGWAILGDGITNVTGWINGESFNIPMYERTDVAEKYPGYPTGNEGFHAYIPLKYLKFATNSLELYAYHNTDCYHIGNVEFTFTDTEAPVISNVTVKEDSEGYTITCDVSDNIGIDYVQFPTWTTVNGQDDLVGNDGSWAYLECYRGTYADGKATFRVNKSEHNDETGQYQTDIYAHDKCNNESKYTLKYTIEDKVEEPPHSHSYVSKVTKEATCTEKGVKTYTCECKDSYTEEIPVKGHSYEEGSCIRCGAKDPDYVPETEVYPTSPQIIVESVTASAGETVDVKISLKNNPGIASMKLKVAYDSVLKLESVTYNNQLGGMSQQPQSMTNPVVLNWFNGSSNTNGDMIYATLKFKISDTGQLGTSAIVNVSYNEEDVYNIAEENVNFAIVNGAVEIISYIPGDINGDKEVNNKDVTRLFQYFSDWDVEVVEEALDVNGDGSINNKDLTRLFQYLSDWKVEIH